MGFLNHVATAVKKEWAKITVGDKFRIAARMLCAFGSGAIGGVLSAKYINEEHPGVLEGTAVVTTAVGLAWAASDMAYKAWDNYIGLAEDVVSLARNDLGEEKETEEVVG